jgi:hypothetical protein
MPELYKRKDPAIIEALAMRPNVEVMDYELNMTQFDN